MDQATATAFFEQLEKFSFRALVKLGLDGNESPWGQAKMAAAPKGAVIHYTADPDMQRVLRWFCDPANQAKASAHVVVSPRKESWAAGLDKDLPLVQSLPVTVVQCRRPSEVAWHATWTNAFAYGIENINTGEIREAADSFVWWKPRNAAAGEWTTPFKGLAPLSLYKRYWEAYTVGQLMANVLVLRCVQALFAGSLQRSWVVGHEHVQGVRTVGAGNHDKRDPGPHFPMHELRQAVFQVSELPAIERLLGASCDAKFAETWRQRAAAAALVAAELPSNGDPWPNFVAATRSLPEVANSRIICKTMLHLLGYCIPAPTLATVDADDTASVYLLQKLQGLTADGVIGPQTRQAIAARFADRFNIAL